MVSLSLYYTIYSFSVYSSIHVCAYLASHYSLHSKPELSPKHFGAPVLILMVKQFNLPVTFLNSLRVSEIKETIPWCSIW